MIIRNFSSLFRNFSQCAAAAASLFAMGGGMAASAETVEVERQDAGAESSVYSRLYEAFTKHPARMAGSDALEESFQALEKELRGAGLAPKRQTFPTLVQETERLELVYDGKRVEGALMVDNGPAPWARSEPIAGPVVFVGNGSVADQDGKNLKGAIAVIDVTLNGVRIPDAFTSGAKAVLLVGDESIDQWRMSRMSFTTISLVPRIYVPRAEAEAAGLLAADGSAAGSIDARAVLKDREACNLWVELPAKKKWVGGLGREEALVLSARLDTYGFTPDLSPENRFAANAALLADTAVALAKSGELNRKVVVVFFGAHYAGQEGARFFYHAVDMADDGDNAKDVMFPARLERYQEELAQVSEYIAFIGANNVVGARGNAAREMQQRLKKELVSAVGTQRGQMGELRLELASLADTPENRERIAELEKIIAAGDKVREGWNSMREQLFKGKFLEDSEENPRNQAVYDEMMAKVRSSLELRRGELQQIIRDTKTWIELSAVFANTDFVAHFDFDFANDRDPWMFSMINAYGLYRNSPVDNGVYLRHLDAFRKLYYGDGDEADGRKALAEGKNWKSRLYRPALDPIYKPYSLSVPSQRVVPSAVSTGLGYAGFQMMTVGDQLAHDALPFADEVDLSGLRGQMAELCREFGNSTLMSLRRVYTSEKREDRLLYNNEKGVNFLNYSAGTTDNEGLPRNSILQFSGISMTDPLCGISHLPRARILANGFVYMPMISRSVATATWRARVIGVGYADDGSFERVSTEKDASGILSTPNHMFYAHGGLAFDVGYPPDPIGGNLYEPKIMIASKDAAFKTSGSFRVGGDRTEFFADRDDKIKRIGGNGEMILGSTQTDGRRVDDAMISAAMGKGVPIDAEYSLSFNGVAQGANDAHILNEVRLRTLRERNIVRDDLEELHADARDHIEDAKRAAAGKKWALARAHHVFATCIENRIYRPLRGVTEDLVQAVVVLLLLNIPFAFAMERLIFGFTNIYKQLVGFCGFFLATFSILFFTHPAFSLASAPIVIFLAFVIILLSVVTTALMMGKIKQEIRAMQGLASTVHGAESDSSTMLSAILIGISGMRNRPLKTFLTSVTVVLLTFTILVFASFTPQEGVVESHLGRSAGENRVELHRLSWLHIDKTLTQSIELLHRDKFDVYRRGGIFRDPTRGGDTGTTPLLPERVLYNPRNQKSLQVNAVVGYDPGEFARNPEFAKVAPGLVDGVFPRAPLFLPEILAAQLGAEKGDDIYLNGITFAYGGAFDSSALQNMSTLDDMKVLPPDYQTMMANAGSSSTGSMTAESLEEMSTGSFEWFSSEMVAIGRMSDLDELFPSANVINFLALYPRSDAVDIEAEAKRLAVAFQGAVHVKSAAGAKKLFFTKAVEGSGFADVVVPLLLGGLIIFSSLMGSIVDREKEIFTYSALGLSPPNVGALFFAESAVYSVIGGMGGYLISQVIAKVFSVLGQRGIMTPPEMNFSSLTSVCTILIVMGVVMLSTIFPAMRASKSANPGVARKWKMPSPEGDLMKFVFPFTVSEHDFAGILSFIREHFSNHSDATLGAFAAKEVKLFKLHGAKGGADALGIEADVSLAPFDLGIFQKFRMYSSEFEIPGIDEVVVELRRIGGTPSSWIRSNRAFAAELREQFLLWRSLPIETIEHYRAQTADTLGK